MAQVKMCISVHIFSSSLAKKEKTVPSHSTQRIDLVFYTSKSVTDQCTWVLICCICVGRGAQVKRSSSKAQNIQQHLLNDIIPPLQTEKGEKESEREREEKDRAFYDHLITPLHGAEGHTRKAKTHSWKSVALMHILGIPGWHMIPAPQLLWGTKKKKKTLIAILPEN